MQGCSTPPPPPLWRTSASSFSSPLGLLHLYRGALHATGPPRNLEATCKCAFNSNRGHAHTIPTGKHGPVDWPRDVLVLCNTRGGMEGLTILPEVVTVTSLREITVQVLCLNRPLFIPKRTVTAQAYLLPDLTSAPVAMSWVATDLNWSVYCL